jgi:hypothetical protein
MTGMTIFGETSTTYGIGRGVLWSISSGLIMIQTMHNDSGIFRRFELENL